MLEQHENLRKLLRSLSLTDREIDLYFALAAMGVRPASLLAKKVGMDRVVTYKHLKKLEAMGLLKAYVRDGVQYFGIAGMDGVRDVLDERSFALTQLQKVIPAAESELQSIIGDDDMVPLMQVFQGRSGVSSLLRDALYEANAEKVRRLRMMTTNTFEQQMGEHMLTKHIGTFFRDAKRSNIAIEMIEASGTLMPEYVRLINPTLTDLKTFPASRGATTVILVGTAVYISYHGSSHVGLKLKHPSMSQMFHFFFDLALKRLI